MKLRASLSPALLSLLLGCNPVPDEPPSVTSACEGEVVVVPLVGTTEVVRTDLTVTGTADHTGDLTIRSFTVAGLPVEKTGFNYETWKVVLPLATLRLLGPDADSQVDVPVVAVDACKSSFPSSFPLTIGRPVTALSLSVTYPAGETYVPANGKFPATLAITANVEAAGATVLLTAPDGVVLGGVANGQVALAKGETEAFVSVLVSGAKAGTAFLLAESEGRTSAPATVLVAGPPTLFPSAQTLTPKQSIRVSVATQGRVESCQATPAEGLIVVSGGQNLMASPGAGDENGDGTVDVDITVADTLAAESTVTITCRDPFGQVATGTYKAIP